MSGTTSLSIEDVIERIVAENERLRKFWSNAHGWAPGASAQLLSEARLDWQVALSHCLRLWVKPFTEHEGAGRLILGYANLGSLVEGTTKLLLVVYYKDYSSEPDVPERKKKLIDPDSLKFETLRQFVKKKKILSGSWDAWIERVQGRRNAIHAFKNRDIGTHNDLLLDMRRYLKFIEYVDTRLPYPESEEANC